MATLTIRPNGAGATMNWNAEGGDYTRVDEVTSDGDTTRLYTPTANNVATFAMENHGSESGTINSVTVYIFTRGLDPISNVVQLAVRMGGTDYFSSNQTYNNTSYHNESAAWSTNPNTSSAWTWTDIDNLEAGMKHISGGGQCVTQVWAVVDYTDNTTPTIALNTTDATDFGTDTTPTLEFTGTDTESDDVRYQVVINGTGGFANGYSYRKKLTQDSTKVSGGADLTDVDVLYSVTDAALKTTSNGGKVEHASGYDIRFETTGGTQLKHDVIFWSATTGQLITNIKIPTLTYAADTEIYMYYGKSGLSATESDEVNVYNSAYKGVWHMKEDPSGSAPQILDSTSNNYDMTSGGTMTSGDLVDGKIYKAIEFDGSDDYLTNTAWSSVITGNGARTISAWFNITTTPDANWISWGAAGGNQLSSMGCYANSIGYLGYANDNTVSGAPYDDGAWHKMSITHDGSTMKILIDGTEVFSGSESLATSTGADLYFGRFVSGAYLPGKLADIRISNSARTNGWEITQYNAENDNATFWTTGLEELGPEEVSAVSGTDSGFTNTVTGGDTDPFNSGEKVSFTVQAGDALTTGTYSWTARVKDPTGTDTWSSYATARTFTIDTSGGSGTSNSLIMMMGLGT